MYQNLLFTKYRWILVQIHWAPVSLILLLLEKLVYDLRVVFESIFLRQIYSDSLY